MHFSKLAALVVVAALSAQGILAVEYQPKGILLYVPNDSSTKDYSVYHQ